MSEIIICTGGPTFETRRIRLCPTEGVRRRFYVREQHWYGSEWNCLGCGDRWADGERGERPFMRGWRQEAIARAKRGWDGVTVRAEDRHRLWRAWIEGAFS